MAVATSVRMRSSLAWWCCRKLCVSIGPFCSFWCQWETIRNKWTRTPNILIESISDSWLICLISRQKYLPLRRDPKTAGERGVALLSRIFEQATSYWNAPCVTFYKWKSWKFCNSVFAKSMVFLKTLKHLLTLFLDFLCRLTSMAVVLWTNTNMSWPLTSELCISKTMRLRQAYAKQNPCVGVF